MRGIFRGAELRGRSVGPRIARGVPWRLRAADGCGFFRGRGRLFRQRHVRRLDLARRCSRGIRGRILLLLAREIDETAVELLRGAHGRRRSALRRHGRLVDDLARLRAEHRELDAAGALQREHGDRAVAIREPRDVSRSLDGAHVDGVEPGVAHLREHATRGRVGAGVLHRDPRPFGPRGSDEQQPHGSRHRRHMSGAQPTIEGHGLPTVSTCTAAALCGPPGVTVEILLGESHRALPVVGSDLDLQEASQGRGGERTIR